MTKRFATVPIYADSSGREVIPKDAVTTGTIDLIAECDDRKRRLDERDRKLNIRECEQNIRERQLDARTDSIASRENAFKRNVRLKDAVKLMKSLKARMDSIEEEERARNEEPITLPPGSDLDNELEGSADEGDPTVKEAPNEHDDADDIDVGVLPLSPTKPKVEA
jgi:hypothetical protein